MTKVKGTILCVLPLATLVAGCGGGVVDQSDNGPDRVSSQSVPPKKRGHWVRRSGIFSQAAVKPAAGQEPQLTYGGGPVISNIKPFIITWGAKSKIWPAGLSALQTYWNDIPKSSYVAWLNHDYKTPSQTIGLGSTLQGIIEDTGVPKGSTIDDTQIAQEIQRLASNGTIKPDNNTYYQIVFPPGITITAGPDTFCQNSGGGTPCAYHNSTTTSGGQNIYYSPQPDYSGQCGVDCGFVPGNNIASLTTATSHEMTEAITDAEVGDNNLAWTDPGPGTTKGFEIGDECEGESQGQQVDGIFVQTEWSNSQHACILGLGGNCTPQCGGKQCGSDGCNGSCGTCPNGETCDPTGQCTTQCTPNCSGKQCGPDGCGGTCGTCPNGQMCNASSGQCQSTGGKCSHNTCSTGKKLVNGCDACVVTVCDNDDFCCTVRWDSQCVQEAQSWCDGNGCFQ
jgi:hypothetical protein